ncbi:hypothetical protein [Acinetobacter baumannii]|uniref:hypothetical protein n=1 Tax=Acinetobacter baumannii TaxID=470 RepID=UPI003B429EDA
MHFNYSLNERLLAFARNIAALVLIGGFGLFVIDRAMTQQDLKTYEYLVLLCSGLVMFFWSIYLTGSNIAILYHDYRDDLLKILEKQNIQHNLTKQQLKSTSRIITVLGQKSWSKMLPYFFRSFLLGLICFVFILLYTVGVISALNQQNKLFDFFSPETKCSQNINHKPS